MPLSWFLKPLEQSIKTVVRPCTALTRRKELTVEHRLPREAFEAFMEPLTSGDAEGLARDPQTNMLVPTRKTAALRFFEYTIRRGSVSDRLFHLDTLDPEPSPPKPSCEPPSLSQIGDEGIFEVENICARKKVKSRILYLVKWRDWPDSANSWVAKSNVDPQMVAAYEGKVVRPRRVAAPSRPKRPSPSPSP